MILQSSTTRIRGRIIRQYSCNGLSGGHPGCFLYSYYQVLQDGFRSWRHCVQEDTIIINSSSGVLSLLGALGVLGLRFICIAFSRGFALSGFSVSAVLDSIPPSHCCRYATFILSPTSPISAQQPMSTTFLQFSMEILSHAIAAQN